MQKSARFFRLKRAKTRPLSIARVSDLLRSGSTGRAIALDFVRINQEVWGNLTGPQFL